MEPPYRRFVAWQRCHELAIAIYRATERFPSAERYGMAAQARRAAFSAAANIVEGSAKRGSAEFARYLDISIGSLNELSYILLLAHELGILTQEEFARLDDLRNTAGALTWKLYTSLKRKGRPG